MKNHSTIVTSHRTVDDVPELLRIMRECHAAIVGLSALAFILEGPGPFPYTFAVPHNHADQFIDHLLTRCSFRLQRITYSENNQGGDYCRQPSPRSRLPGVGRVIHMNRSTRRDRIIVAVAVTGTQEHPGVASLPVAFVTNTLTCNYVTADGLVSAYPSLTLRRRSLFHLQRVPPLWTNPSLSSYARDGIDFRIRPDNWDTDCDGHTRPCARSWLSPCARRSFGDRGSLIVSFNGSPVDAQGPTWVWGGVAGCTTHGHRTTRVHMPGCNC